ncbi:unnamed protein product [Lampetra fluviatilis]
MSLRVDRGSIWGHLAAGQSHIWPWNRSIPSETSASRVPPIAFSGGGSITGRTSAAGRDAGPTDPGRASRVAKHPSYARSSVAWRSARVMSAGGGACGYCYGCGLGTREVAISARGGSPAALLEVDFKECAERLCAAQGSLSRARDFTATGGPTRDS